MMILLTGYYKEALEEFEHTLEVRKKLSVSIDIATTHRFLGETLCKLGTDFERAKRELNTYYSITLKLKDLVEIQRAHTTLGNYYMSLFDFKNLKEDRNANLNEAYTHYLKSYDVLNEIAEKHLVDSKEFAIMKARSCLNCGKCHQIYNFPPIHHSINIQHLKAFVLDERRDLVICNEYLKTAIELCE